MAGRSEGRRLLSLEGGNRGVVAQDAVLLQCYGDCKLALDWRSVRTVVPAVVCAASISVFGGSSRISMVSRAWLSIDLACWSGVRQSGAVTVR